MQNIHYSVAGTGSTLVLLHGFCEDSRVWQAIGPSLEKQYRVVYIDSPGFGKSPLASNAGDISLEDMADRIAALLRHLQIEKSTLIGHSMGGYITLAFAQKYPELLNGWGLFHSTAYPDTEEKKADRLKQVEFVKKNGVTPYVNTLIPGLFAKSYPYIEQKEQSLKMARECSPEGITNALLAMRNRPERIQVLQNAAVPVLIIAGAEDELVPPEKASYQASLPARCQFELLEKSGHMGMVEQPVESIDILNRFMEFVKQASA